MPTQRIRAFGAVAAAVVVVALLAALFTSFGGGRRHPNLVGCGGSSCATGTPDSATPTAAPASPYSQYITNVALANGVDSSGQPIGPTGPFLINQKVYIVMRVDNPPPGLHTIWVRWFINGSPAPLAKTDTFKQVVTGSSNVWFTLSSTQAGAGTVRVLWDPPAGDTGTNLSDPHLVASIDFVVYATPPAATPAPGATPAPSPTPTASLAGPQGPTPSPSPAG